MLPDDTLYYNIAKRLVEQVYGEAYDLGEAAAVQVQKAINQASGLGLNAVTDAAQKAEKITSLIDTASGSKIDGDGAKALLDDAKTIAINGVGNTMEANADFQGSAGLRPKITRKASFKCCEWCAGLSGTYNYPNVPHDVYRRHENCRCTVEYDPGTGRRQNVYTKRWSSTDSTEQRKTVQQNLQKAALQQEEKSATMKAQEKPADTTVPDAILSGKVKDEINVDLQKKHCLGLSDYDQEKSGLYGDVEDAKKLYERLKTTGVPVKDKNGNWTNKERVVNDTPVGVCNSAETNAVMIVYSKTGSHIYPRAEGKHGTS